ncbi:DUF5047 domain-containing protein [Pseudonocardia sp. WMMC193]|uniref:DUF5047 domain-containing protein n=1 Tax=Pseudonocardia sp. WMMC193 TaxID=2911965 RepID=UPI001F4064A3|nr:DUF5047 domain-containing protein [Pseudonocardia sp. WMMC193]MCF7550964.1 DUF5047 domain-containing protein [Pseudonocardia sp. WMMC193]
MWPISAAARQTLRSSHAITARCRAYTTDGRAIDHIPIESATVTCDAKSQVRRTASLLVSDPRMWPYTGTGALSPLGAELALEFGIVIPGRGTEWVPMIRGPIQKVGLSRPLTSGLAVELADRSKSVADDRFDQPTQTRAGQTCVQEITRLITETLPGAVVVDETGDTTAAPVLDIDKERWADGVERLADAIGAECFADPVGVFRIRYQPRVTDTPVWVIDSGETGVLVKADTTLTREQVYNAVICTGERTDGTPPVFAKVVDDDATSPTFYGGPFGRKPRFFSSPLLLTNAQAAVAGAGLLARVRGLGAHVDVDTITNPGLEAGDVVEVRLDDGTRQRHILDKVPIDTAPSAAQKLTTRSIDLPSES